MYTKSVHVTKAFFNKKILSCVIFILTSWSWPILAYDGKRILQHSKQALSDTNQSCHYGSKRPNHGQNFDPISSKMAATSWVEAIHSTTNTSEAWHMMVKGYYNTPSTLRYQPVMLLWLTGLESWAEFWPQPDSWVHLLAKIAFQPRSFFFFDLILVQW